MVRIIKKNSRYKLFMLLNILKNILCCVKTSNVYAIILSKMKKKLKIDI